MKNPLGNKLYYSISEVAGMTDLQPYTLRAWEKEFSCLRPRRSRGKNRAYRDRDIAIILLIKKLLYEDRYTTEGVKQKLKNEPELLRRAIGQAAESTASLRKEVAASPSFSEEEVQSEREERMSLKEWVEGTKKDLEEILKLL